MTRKLRDALWLSALVILLLCWLLDWRFTQARTADLQREIQQLRAKPPPIEFVNANFDSAVYFVQFRLNRDPYRKLGLNARNIKINLDLPSLRKAGVQGRTKVTCRIDENAIPESIERMVPGKILVTATPEGFDVRGRIDK
jgi:hypothetical protein